MNLHIPLSLSFSLDASGQSKVTQLDLQIIIEEQVSQLDVPVYYLLQEEGREGEGRSE